MRFSAHENPHATTLTTPAAFILDPMVTKDESDVCDIELNLINLELNYLFGLSDHSAIIFLVDW